MNSLEVFAVFPGRVGRLILDGVVNPETWSNEPPHQLQEVSFAAAHKGLSHFVEECVKAGPDRCAFAVKGESDEDMLRRIINLIDRAYNYKKTNSSALFGSATIRNHLWSAAYTPWRSGDVAKKLAGYDKTLSEAEGALALASKGPLWSPASVEHDADKNGLTSGNKSEKGVSFAYDAIVCGDAIDPGNITTRDVFRYMLVVPEALGHCFGPRFSMGGTFCHRWPVRAVERFNGPWNKKPSNKILIIGNKGDPITPLLSAKTLAGRYGGKSAVLIEQDSYGHLSINQHSNCTMAIVERYLINNTLPDSFRKVCGADKELFPQSRKPGDINKTGAEASVWFNVVITPVVGLLLVVAYLLASYMRTKKSNALGGSVLFDIKAAGDPHVESGRFGDLNKV
ncbi:Abhydrolase domain-containing protein [Ceratobasidium sp. AG-Ba]|nr:Abhydrolase domain-containing protein [Ceratobasidium sp. AG-Ba]